MDTYITNKTIPMPVLTSVVPLKMTRRSLKTNFETFQKNSTSLVCTTFAVAFAMNSYQGLKMQFVFRSHIVFFLQIMRSAIIFA